MNFKKILLGSAIFAAGFGLIACGDDSSSGPKDNETSEDIQKDDDQKDDADESTEPGSSSSAKSSSSVVASSSSRCIEMVLDSAILTNDINSETQQSISLKTGGEIPKHLELRVDVDTVMFERSMLLSVYEADLSTGLEPGTLPAETPVCKSMFEINEDTEISSSRFGATDGAWYIAKDSDNEIYPFFATDIKVESTEDQTIGQLKLYYYKKKGLR
ncbi:MAG: hypothetical protein MJY93_06760 [Fibrobacter sp.]|nr:hypothetical protein [Fibrobacter sp.]